MRGSCFGFAIAFFSTLFLSGCTTPYTATPPEGMACTEMCPAGVQGPEGLPGAPGVGFTRDDPCTYVVEYPWSYTTIPGMSGIRIQLTTWCNDPSDLAMPAACFVEGSDETDHFYVQQWGIVTDSASQTMGLQCTWWLSNASHKLTWSPVVRCTKTPLDGGTCM